MAYPVYAMLSEVQYTSALQAMMLDLCYEWKVWHYFNCMWDVCVYGCWEQNGKQLSQQCCCMMCLSHRSLVSFRNYCVSGWCYLADWLLFKYAEECVRLSLVRSMCLTLPTYYMGALDLPSRPTGCDNLEYVGMTASVKFFIFTGGNRSLAYNITVGILLLAIYTVYMHCVFKKPDH